MLLKLCKKYDDLKQVDKLSSVSEQIDSVKLVMQDNIDLALRNCIQLESVERAAGTIDYLLIIWY